MTDSKSLREKLDAMVRRTEPQFLTALPPGRIYTVALDLLAKLDTVEARGKWIPCSERMPDKDGEYLVWISNDTDNADGIYLELRIYQRYWEGFDESVVTHWMPLPAPPTEPTMTQDPEVG